MQMDERRMEFVRAADELFAEKGIANTSVADICQRVGVTRSLLYHYFRNKEDVTDAVTYAKTMELVYRLRQWTQEVEAIGVHDALSQFARLIREYLCTPASFGSSIMRERNAELIMRFAMMSSDIMTQAFVDNLDKDGSLISRCKVKHPAESFYILCLGMIATLLLERDVSDDQLAEILIDMLHIAP